MPRQIRASHATTAREESITAARDAHWRRVDAANAPKPQPKPKVTAKVMKPKVVKPEPVPRDLPPGYLLLDPDEAASLGRLLDSHPATRRETF